MLRLVHFAASLAAMSLWVGWIVDLTARL